MAPDTPPVLQDHPGFSSWDPNLSDADVHPQVAGYSAPLPHDGSVDGLFQLAQVFSIPPPQNFSTISPLGPMLAVHSGLPSRHPQHLQAFCVSLPGRPSPLFCQRVEIHKLRQGENLILGFSIGGGIDQDPSQNPFSEDKTDKGIYVTRVSEGGPAEIAGLQIGDKIMQVNGWDMTMVTHDQARKRLTKRSEEVVRLLVTRQSLQKAVQQSMLS